jgi:hypothetical protein
MTCGCSGPFDKSGVILRSLPAGLGNPEMTRGSSSVGRRIIVNVRDRAAELDHIVFCTRRRRAIDAAGQTLNGAVVDLFQKPSLGVVAPRPREVLVESRLEIEELKFTHGSFVRTAEPAKGRHGGLGIGRAP